MPTKPTVTPQWATDHTPDPAGTASDPSNPNVSPAVAKQEAGFVYEEEVPFNWINWLFYITFKWIEWLNSFNELHEHGIAGDYGAPKISLVAGMDWGSNGEQEVITDTTALHEIAHTGLNGAQSKHNADILQAKLLRIGLQTNQYVDINNGSGLADVQMIQFVSTGAGDKTGISTQAFRPALLQGPGGNFQSLFPMDQSLYIKNLIKAEAVARIFEQTESANNSLSDSYNLTGNILTDVGTDSFYFNINDSTSFNGGITSNIGGNGGASSHRVIVEAYYKGASDQVWFQIFWWNTTTDAWVNVLDSIPTGFDCEVTIRVT